MAYKHSILGLAVVTSIMLATGCGKQEPSATPAVDNATKSQAPVVSEKPQPVQPPKAAEIQPAVTAKPDTVGITGAAPKVSAPTPASAAAVPVQTTNSIAVQPPKSAADQPMAKSLVAAGGDAAKTTAGAVRTQQLSLAQMGTNQLQSLAAAATNRVLAALGMTNQVSSMTTNQVQALLEQAKNLTSNQKYQEALATLTQLYATKLTPEQKQQADNIKSQAQAALTQKAASALGNFLGGKK